MPWREQRFGPRTTRVLAGALLLAAVIGLGAAAYAAGDDFRQEHFWDRPLAPDGSGFLVLRVTDEPERRGPPPRAVDARIELTDDDGDVVAAGRLPPKGHLKMEMRQGDYRLAVWYLNATGEQHFELKRALHVTVFPDGDGGLAFKTFEPHPKPHRKPGGGGPGHGPYG